MHRGRNAKKSSKSFYCQFQYLSLWNDRIRGQEINKNIGDRNTTKHIDQTDIYKAFYKIWAVYVFLSSVLTTFTSTGSTLNHKMCLNILASTLN